MPMSAKSPFAAGSMPSATSSRRVVLSYIFDYVVIIVLIVGFLALDAIEPYHQEFSLRNYTLQYKYAVHERIPNLPLAAIAVVSPLVIIVFWTLVVDGIFSHKVDGRKKKYTMKQRLWELNCGLLGLGLSISLQYVIVASLKNAIGKPRPDLIDRCRPKEGAQDPQPFGLSNSTICTQRTHAILKDGFRSFPSGHSSTAFGGLFYLSLYFAGKLHVLDSRGEVWKLFIVLTPSLGAALVAGSRIMDARHHPFDVLSGSLIGIIFAWAAYRQYFPSVGDFQAKGRAYSMRTWGGGPMAKGEKAVEEAYDYQEAIPQEDDPVGITSSSSMHGGSSPALSTNAFRDEMSSPQRLRRLETRRKQLGSPQPGSPPPVPVHRKPIGPQGNPSDAHWADEDITDEYELQPQYRRGSPLTRPYEPYRANEQTAYQGGSVPAARLASTQTTEGGKTFPASIIPKPQGEAELEEVRLPTGDGIKEVRGA